ncbi:MAG: hypothetical protein ACFNLL_00225 [Bacteroides sp.]|jgi:hypothetical protein
MATGEVAVSEQVEQLDMSYSVEEIVSLFEDVDQKIQDLHQCSADDFLGLNAKFKNFYKESKSVSSDATTLLALFSHEQNEQLKEELTAGRTELQLSLDSMKEQQYETLRLVHDLGDAMSAYLFPLRHINNEFGILNMELIALEVSFRTALLQNNFDTKSFQQMIRDWEEFVYDITETKKLSQSFLEECEYSLHHIELIGGRGLRSLVTLTELTEQGLILFDAKQKESNQNLPAIRAKSDSVAKSIADVITSLQYQDIIRQKMEHIQQAHVKLLDDLQQIDLDKSPNAWTQVLVQVRDISALQAAQLLATNKEYQAAIEAIALHFRTIAKEMTSVASICRSTMNDNDDREQRSTITDLVDRFKRADALLARVLEVFPECSREVLLIRDGASMLQKRIGGHVETFFRLSTQVEVMLSPYRKTLGRHFEHYMLQIDEMLSTMRRNMESVSVQNAILIKSIEGLGRYAKKLAESELLWDYVQLNVKRSHSLSERLFNTEQESNALLRKIETTCRSISDETQAALAAVRYYDFFENVIAEIVRGLSSMSSRICAEVDVAEHGDMSAVRDLYTMESERKIHDQFTGTNEEEAPADDDDLELF